MEIDRLTGRSFCATLVFIMLSLIPGCASSGPFFSSKWAMDDARYADRFSGPYSKRPLNKLLRQGEEIIDARFQEGRSGLYTGAGIATRQLAAAVGEVGMTWLPTSWSTMRVGVEGMLAEGLPTYLTGGIVGVRLHSPTRFSPYVGVAGMAGVSDTSTTAQSTYIDKQGNLVQEGDRVPGVTKGLAAIIPEVGMSYWFTSRVRLNVGASYYMTTDAGSGSSNKDFVLTTMSLDWLFSRESEIQNWRDPAPTSQPTDATEGVESKPYFVTEDQREAPVNDIHDADADVEPSAILPNPIDELRESESKEPT